MSVFLVQTQRCHALLKSCELIKRDFYGFEGFLCFIILNKIEKETLLSCVTVEKKFQLPENTIYSILCVCVHVLNCKYSFCAHCMYKIAAYQDV